MVYWDSGCFFSEIPVIAIITWFMWFFFLSRLGSASSMVTSGKLKCGLSWAPINHSHGARSWKWKHDSLGPAICDLDSCPSWLVKTNGMTWCHPGWRQLARADTPERCPDLRRKQASVCPGANVSAFSISASSSFPGRITEDCKKDTLAWLGVF